MSKIKTWLLFLMVVSIPISSFTQGIRKHYQEMTNDERVAVVAGYSAAGGPTGTSGLNSTLANFHNNNFNAIHFNNQNDDVFFAWHRQASHELERHMKDNANNEWITLPYWDWTISNSKSDPLWGGNWLGPFDASWSLGRSSSSSTNLPTQSDINAALLESNFFQFSRFEIESNSIHTAGHMWTGGVMTSGNSPKDPVFFFHHNMVDKIWSDWYNIYGNPNTNYYTQTSMPRYPNVDPDDIVDPRSLGIFYAEAQHVTLDKYTVDNTFTSSEKFGYQYTIEIRDDFIVPNGKNAEARSCKTIIMRPGFKSDFGSVFLAQIDGDCNFATSAMVNINQRYSEIESSQKTDSNTGLNSIGLNNYPNPFNDFTTIEYYISDNSLVEIRIIDLTGNVILQIEEGEKSKGRYQIKFDGSNLPSGSYFCIIQTNGKTKAHKMLIMH